MIPDLDLQSPDVIAAITQRRTAHEEQQQNLAGIAAATPGAQPHVVVPWHEEMSRQVLVQLNNTRRQQQRTLFPLSEKLSALIFVSLADLTHDQRNTLTSIMTHRGRTLAEYNVQELRDLFLEMFCTTRTAVDSPMMQPSGMAQRRSFLVMDEGEIDGTTGYWAEDEDDGAEGFLKLFKMHSGSIMTMNTHGINEGSKEDPPDEVKVKVKEKEKEKAEEAEDFSDQGEKEKAKAEEKAALTWWEKKDMMMNGKKKMNGMIMTAFGPKNKNGTMPIGAQTNCTTPEKRKRKERKERQERKGR